jgi:hypothetical protein
MDEERGEQKDQRSLSERLADTAAITAAIRKAVREAVLSHARAGRPIAVWRDGRVVWLQPAEVLSGEVQSPADLGEN